MRCERCKRETSIIKRILSKDVCDRCYFEVKHWKKAEEYGKGRWRKA